MSISTSKQLFDDGDGIYNYCPAPVLLDEHNMMIFYCANTVPGVVIDDIYARKGIKQQDEWVFGDKFRVLEPSRTDWDCIHVCDPDVIKGEFHYKGERYNWLLVYLGCDIHYSYHNQIGIAFAKSIEGPYIKYEHNPVVAYTETFHWGAGQPCVVSLDGKGKFRMLYTRSVHDYERRTMDTHTFWCDFDFYDSDQPWIGEPVMMNEGGIVNMEGAGDLSVFNPSIVWDRESDTYYLTREGTPFQREVVPGFISSYTQVLKIPRQLFERNEGGWEVVANISKEHTAFPRNHNTGLMKDTYGWSCMPDLSAAVTVSRTQEQGYLWTYRIHQVNIGG